jgi:L(+)-tartrate dehydratase beta subunit
MESKNIDSLSLKEFHLEVPLQREDTEQLAAGDIVFLSGLIFTGRVRFYQWVLDQHHEPPIDIRGSCNVNFHCSPAASEPAPGQYRISAVTGTASFRFARWMEPLFTRYGVKAIIGKAGMQPEIYRDVFKRHHAVYLSTVGYGLGAMYGRSIRRVVDVYGKEELGLAQAMWVLEVEDLGPLMVDGDTKGNSLQALARDEVGRIFHPLLDRFPTPTLRRYGETAVPDEETF